jgi:hypothetical protein
MTRTATRLLFTLALSAGAATMASAQMGPGSGSPVPGSGDASKISQGNQQSNAAYNQLIGAADSKATKGEVKVQSKHSAVPATAADIKQGVALRGIDGAAVGTIDSLAGEQVVVNTGTTKIGVPLVAFGKDEKGLLLSITGAKFAELVAKAQGSH